MVMGFSDSIGVRNYLYHYPLEQHGFGFKENYIKYPE